MPSIRALSYISRVYVGKSYRLLHSRMNSSKYSCKRGGRNHWHDWPAAVRIAVESYPYDSERAVWAAWNHILVDQRCAFDPTYRLALESWAKADALARKDAVRARKQAAAEKKQVSDLKARFVGDLRKMAEINELVRQIRNSG